MSNEDTPEEVDRVLELLSNPLSRYILSVLAGVNPGTYTGEIAAQEDFSQDDIDQS